MTEPTLLEYTLFLHTQSGVRSPTISQYVYVHFAEYLHIIAV